MHSDFILDFAKGYETVIYTDDVKAERENLQKLLKRKNADDLPKTLLELQSYMHRLKDAFTELDKLLTIACTLPISTAACERSFSTLRIVKPYLRTTMLNERLHDLMILAIHRERATMLNFDAVVSRFAAKFPKCRIQLY